MNDEKNSFSTPVESDRKEEVRYVPVEFIYAEETQEDKIDLLDLIDEIWKGRKILWSTLIVFTLWGLFHYIFSPKEYESQSILIQESRTESPAQQLLQSFGGGAITLGRTAPQGVIPPSLYPQIVESVDFQYGLLFEEIEFKQFSSPITLYDYFTTHYEPSIREKTYRVLVDYTIKLPYTLYRIARRIVQGEGQSAISMVEADDRIRVLSREERLALRELSGRTQIELDGSLITVKTRLPDAKAAAQLNVVLVDRIQEFVVDYRIEKARENLIFIENQLAEAKQRYEQAQQTLAEFIDSNVSLSTATARTQLEYLQNQRDLSYNIYLTISQQVERARLTLQEETPVFSVLQKSNLPTNTAGSSLLILILFMIMGTIIGIVLIFAVKAYHVIVSAMIARVNSGQHSISI